MTNITTSDKANAAIRLQNNEDFRLIMECVERDIFSSFKTISIGENEKLQNIHSLSHGFKLLNDRINKYIELEKYEASKEDNSEE